MFIPQMSVRTLFVSLKCSESGVVVWPCGSSLTGSGYYGNSLWFHKPTVRNIDYKHSIFYSSHWERFICTSCVPFGRQHNEVDLPSLCTRFLPAASWFKWDEWIKQITLDVSREITVLQCVTRCNLVARHRRLARPCCHYTLKIEVLTSYETFVPQPNHIALPQITEIWNQ